MWLYIVICGAVAYYPRDHDVLFVWMPVASVLSSLPSLYSVLSIHLSLHYPILHLAQGRKKTHDGIWTASSSEHRNWPVSFLPPLILLPWIPALLNVFFHPR